jgi:hypothetical protein
MLENVLQMDEANALTEIKSEEAKNVLESRDIRGKKA